MTKRAKGYKVPDSELDWFTIEARFRAGDPARHIAADYDIAHTRVTRRAAKFGWVALPSSLKRERVKASFLGGAKEGRADELMDEAVAQDRQDMDLGLSNARKILRKIEESLDQGVPVVLESKDDEGKAARTVVRVEPAPLALKTLGAANLAATETIRRIRDLDDPDKKPETVYSKEHRDAVFAAALGPNA